MLVQIPQLLEIPWLIHAFTTRAGGVSAPPYDSLNMSFSRPDDPAAVLENRRRVCRALGISLDDLAVAGQVHGTRVALVGIEARGRGARGSDGLLPPADGLITSDPGLVLLGCFADCVPLLFVDRERRAVGMAHAGWRGSVGDMAGAAVRAMVEHLGSDPAHILAVVGPSIGPCCYEVGNEVVEAALAAFPEAREEIIINGGAKAHLNLWAINEAGLRQAGIGEIVRTDLCTACNQRRFFSHRADRGQTGRFAALIGIR